MLTRKGANGVTPDGSQKDPRRAIRKKNGETPPDQVAAPAQTEIRIPSRRRLLVRRGDRAKIDHDPHPTLTEIVLIHVALAISFPFVRLTEIWRSR